MFRTLLAKDLRRAWRNPVPWLVNLALPLCVTALIGLAFGGRSEQDQLGRIKFAIVDEDGSALSEFIRGASNREEMSRHFETVFLDRETAMRQIDNNLLSAVVIIPKHFTTDYIAGHETVSLELIKNPAESIHPAVLEQLLGVVTASLNAVSRNFHSELPAWSKAFERPVNYQKIADLIVSAGDRYENILKYVVDPPVGFAKEVHVSESKPGASFNLFAYLLVGMAGMFLLFLGGSGMTDLQRELRLGTFERYRTLHQRLLPFLAGKILFVVVLVLFGSTVLFVGGGFIFHFHWQHPLAVLTLAFGYACFVAALMALIAVTVSDERQANSLNYIVAITMAIPGGCLFPTERLPDFMRHHLTPLLPTAWFVETVRDLGFGGTTPWVPVVLKFIFLSAVLVALSAFILRRRFEAGARS